jgi:thymidine kinase
MSGWSELIFGSMYCGKSEELIRRLKRVRIAGQTYQLFKPAVDTRYDLQSVSTHDYSEIKRNMETILEVHLHNGNIDADPQNLVQELSKQLSGSMKAIVVKDSEELLQTLETDTDVIGIDEVQFFDEGLIEVIHHLTQAGKRIIMAGLDMYSSGEPFGIVPILACQAKYVHKLHAVCVDCGHDAYISYKIDNTKEKLKSTVDVSSVGKYIALCQSCWQKRDAAR